MISAYLRLSQERPRTILSVAAVATVLLAALTFGRLGFSADREALFEASPTERQRQEDFQKRFGGWKDLVLVLDGSTAANRESTVLKLKERLPKSALFTDVRATLELPGLQRMGLYFLSIDDLKAIDKALKTHERLLTSLATGGWYSFLEQGSLGKGPALGASGEENRKRFTEAWRRSVEGRGGAELGDLFPHIVLPERAFFTDGDQRHLIYFHSDDPLAARAALEDLHNEVQFAGRFVLLGQPLLQAQEQQETIRDALISSALSVIIVQCLLIWGFRETARPRLAFGSLLFGLSWSVSWAALSVGVLNIITINFLTITLGLGIDFSIHLLARYSEERVQHESLKAMEITLRTSGVENLVGAAATSLAFLTLSLTDFRAVTELGTITGLAIWLCFGSVVLLLPPLLFWHEKSHPQCLPALVPSEKLCHTEKSLRSRPQRTLLLGGLLVAVLAVLGTQVRFDYNLLNLQSDTSEAVSYEKSGGYSSLAAFFVAENPQEALEYKTKFEALSSVKSVQTVAELLPQQIASKEPLVRSIVSQAERLPRPTFDPESVPDWTRLRALTDREKASKDDPDWVETLNHTGPGPLEQVWKQMQRHLKAELDRTLVHLRRHQTHLDMSEWKAESSGVLRYSNSDGKTVLRVLAKDPLWERESLNAFVMEFDTVTDRGVGPPFLIRSYLEQMRRSYFDAVKYAVVCIVVLLLLHFRAVLPTVIALVPKVVGTVGMLAAMAVCGVDFNPANCMALPLTLGIGLVFGIHAVHRCLEHPDELLIGGSTGRAISLSAWTTIASFGTLMVASSPGIFSLGFVMAAGVGANLLATYLLVPPLVVLFRDRLKR